MGLPKAHTLQWVIDFFEGLNFTNDQHPQNSWNLRTLKKTNYMVIHTHKFKILAVLYIYIIFNLLSRPKSNINVPA